MVFLLFGHLKEKSVWCMCVCLFLNVVVDDFCCCCSFYNHQLVFVLVSASQPEASFHSISSSDSSSSLLLSINVTKFLNLDPRIAFSLS